LRAWLLERVPAARRALALFWRFVSQYDGDRTRRQSLEMPGRYRFHSTRPAPWKRVSVASSVDRQSKGGVTVSYSGYKRQRGERRRRQVRAKLREIRRNARHSIGRMDRGRSATIGCGETAPAQTAFSCAGLSGRPALRQISAAARVRGLRGNFRPD